MASEAPVLILDSDEEHLAWMARIVRTVTPHARQADHLDDDAGSGVDLIVANLPHFPMEHIEVAGRLPTWSSGGADGREFLDPFIEGLADHFTAKARAVLTHNAFVDIERSRLLAARHGLGLTILASVLVHIAAEKLALMTPSVLLAEEGKSIHRYGPHVFADFHIVEISPLGTQD